LKKFAKDHGLDYVLMINQRSDCRIPKLKDAISYAKALNVSVEELCNGKRLNPETLDPRIKAIADCLASDPEKLDAVEVLLFEKKHGNSGVMVS